jgi:hypothetical protein
MAKRRADRTEYAYSTIWEEAFSDEDVAEIARLLAEIIIEKIEKSIDQQNSAVVYSDGSTSDSIAA